MNSTLVKSLVKGGLLVATAGVLVGCGGGGSSTTLGSFSSPYETATGFVEGLNSVDPIPYDNSYVFYNEGEAIRGDQWTVIWDDANATYKSINMDYIRSIVYTDFYSNSIGLAEEYRAREDFDYLDYGNGDEFAEQWEEATPIYDLFCILCDESDIIGFTGDASGLLYEDKEESKDGSLLVSDEEVNAIAEKVARVSFAFQVAPKTAAKMVKLGSKAEKFTKGGDLTLNDSKELLGDIESLTGKSLNDVMEVANDPAKRKQLIEEVAKNIGADAKSLEDKILPELFGIELN